MLSFCVLCIVEKWNDIFFISCWKLISLFHLHESNVNFATIQNIISTIHNLTAKVNARKTFWIDITISMTILNKEI
jgi:hypothetical protein